jgi:hypothetical protein
MIFDKKKSVSVILSKMNKDGETSEVNVSHESGDHDVYTSLAEDLIAGTKEGSVQKVASVLRSYHEMIEEDDEQDDQEE